MFGYSQGMVVCSMANRSIPGTSHLWKMFCRTEFLTGHLCEPRLLAWAAEVPWLWEAVELTQSQGQSCTARAALPPDGARHGSFPLSADKLHSCGVTCQHLQRGSPETNQECSACQTVALSHYIETTFLSELWALSEQEWGIHWHSDLQPCNHRQSRAVRPDLQFKEGLQKHAKSM